MEVSLQEILMVPPLDKARIIAGMKGLSRTITSIKSIKNQGFAEGIEGSELILINGYDSFLNMRDLIQKADAKGAAGIILEFKQPTNDIAIEVINLANELSFPIVSLPFQHGRVDYINRIWSVILDKDKEDISIPTKVMEYFTRVVLADEGFDAIVQTAGTTLNRPCALFDIQGNLISYFGYYPGFWHEVDKSYHNSLPNTEVCEGIYSCRNKESISESFQIISTIKKGNEHFGNFFVLSPNTLSNNELIILRQVLMVSCLEFQKKKTFETIEQNHRGSFINDLILGLVVDESIIKKKLAFYDLKLEAGGTVVIVDFFEKTKQTDPFNQNIANIRSLLNNYSNNDHVIYTYLAEQLVIIIPFRYSVVKTVNNIMKILENNLPEGKFKIAIGRDITDIYKIHLSYLDARNILKLAKFYNEKILDYKKLGLVRLLLDKIERESLKEFFQEYLAPIIDYQLEHNINLLDTLEAYYQENCNIRNTGKKLYIHFNTVRYRLNLLKDISKLDIDHPDVRATLTIALKLRKFIE